MKQKKKKSHSILVKIMIPLVFLSAIQIFLLTGMMIWGGIGKKMNQYSFDQAKCLIRAYADFLEEKLNANRIGVQNSAKQINKKVEEYFAQNPEAKKRIDREANDFEPLLLELLPDVIALLRLNQVSGAFFILNTQDLKADVENENYQNKPGIYIRDNSPLSELPSDQSDLFLVRMPDSLIEETKLAKDIAWQPEFVFQEGESYYPFLYEPYQAACEAKGKDFGYWSPIYSLYRDSTNAISYSVPLVLSDGTVYGVLGVELSLDLIKQFLPDEMPKESMISGYAFAYSGSNPRSYTMISAKGAFYEKGNIPKTFQLAESRDYKSAYLISGTEYAAVSNLKLYEENTAYENQIWSFIGLTPKNMLFSFAESMYAILFVVILGFFSLGFISIFLVGYLVANPLRHFVLELNQYKSGVLEEFTQTGISEIDQIREYIEQIKDKLLKNTKDFTKLLSYIPNKTAGFCYNSTTKEFLITDNFMSLFHLDNVCISDYEEWQLKQEDLKLYLVKQEADFFFYHFPMNPENWVRFRFIEESDTTIGIAEDITEQVLTHQEEPCYFTNTVLKRRVFYKKMETLLHQKEEQKIAALLMLDLDQVEEINDRYGYAFGDTYIKYVIQCIVEFSPPNALISRISGDQFYIFYYGYHTRNEIEIQIQNLKRRLEAETIPYSSKETVSLRISGSVAWNPCDLLTMEDIGWYSEKESGKEDL